MARLRDIATLERLIDKHGDVKLSELLERLSNTRPGRPPKWDFHSYKYVYFAVEAMRAAGFKPVEAQTECAKYLKTTENIIEKLHRQARKDIGPLFRPHAAKILRQHLLNSPRLKRICDKKAAAKTPQF
jgi:hypothetical protein